MKGLKYHLFEGRTFHQSQNKALFEKAYHFWKDSWTQVYAEIDKNSRLNLDDFFRQDRVAILTVDEQIAAMHFYSFFPLNSISAQGHSYMINNFPEGICRRLLKEGYQNMMSMESMIIAPEFRRSRKDLPITGLLPSLGFEIFKEKNCDVMVAPCRVDLKVHERAVEHGATPYSPVFNLHEVPVILMKTDRQSLKQHPDPLVCELTQTLWNQKNCDFEITQISSPERKAA